MDCITGLIAVLSTISDQHQPLEDSRSDRLSSSNRQVDDIKSELSQHNISRLKDLVTPPASQDEVIALSGQKSATKGDKIPGNLSLQLEDDNKKGDSFTANALTRAIKRAENEKNSPRAQRKSAGRKANRAQQKALVKASPTGQGDADLQVVVAEDDAHNSTQPLSASDKELDSEKDENDENLGEEIVLDTEIPQQRTSSTGEARTSQLAGQGAEDLQADVEEDDAHISTQPLTAADNESTGAQNEDIVEEENVRIVDVPQNRGSNAGEARTIEQAESAETSQRNGVGRPAKRIQERARATSEDAQDLQAEVNGDDVQNTPTQSLRTSDHESGLENEQSEEEEDEETVKSVDVPQRRNANARKVELDETIDSLPERSNRSDNKGKSIAR